jgi:ATP-binding cassette subfamily F protein 3
MFHGDDIDKKVSVLSGGERTRLAMVKLLLEPVNLLILDEPTNHLDLKSKDVLKEALKNFDGTMILVSHDRDFLQGLSEKVFEFKDKRIIEHFETIDAFLERNRIKSIADLQLSK